MPAANLTTTHSTSTGSDFSTEPGGHTAESAWHDGVMRIRTLILGAALAAGAAAAVSAVMRRKSASGEHDAAEKQGTSKVFEYRKVEGDFLETAPVKGTITKTMPASAATVFKVLEDDEAWTQWLDPIQQVTWTSPLGPGATRQIQMGNMTIDEQFFEWEQDRLMSFRFERSPLPLIEAFAERWRVEPISDTESEVTWNYGLQARGPLKAAHPMIAKGLPAASAKWLDQLAEYVAAHAGEYAEPTNDAG